MSRRFVVVAGLAAAAAFLAGVALTSAWSQIAGRPILDGLSAPPPYNWVQPPPTLAKGNQEPARGSFELSIGPSGSAADVLSTGDVQFTLVADKGMLPRTADDASARIEVTPLDPAGSAPLPNGLEPQGNVYRIEGTNEPSGRRIQRLASPSQVVLLYPAQAGGHQRHTILFSSDGRRWQELKTSDVPNLQQAGADIEAFGEVVVGAPPVPSPTASPETGGAGIPVVVWVVLASVVLVGLGLATRLFSGRGGSSPSS